MKSSFIVSFILKIELCLVRKYNFLVIQGDLVSIISKGGSKIHIYSVNEYQLIYCLWRGKVDEEILDLTFSKKNKFLCLVNTKNTIHIFAMDPTDHNIITCHCHEIEQAEKHQPQGLFTRVFSKVKVTQISYLEHFPFF